MRTFCSINPTNETILGEFPIMSPADIEYQYQNAVSASETWRRVDWKQRLSKLDELRLLLLNNAEDLATTIHQEIGKPIQEAYSADILSAANALKWLTKRSSKDISHNKLRPNKTLTAEPLGVIGVIGTWNYPLFLNLVPIAWALAAGNSVLFKPSELSALTAERMSILFTKIGLPVFTLQGDASTGRALCQVGCNKIAFTGGVSTGRAICSELAKTATPSVMELSGCDAMIVCADAPLEATARSAVWGRCSNVGQSCVAPQRIFVESSIYPQFLKLCQQEMVRLQQGRDYGAMRTDTFRRCADTMVKDALFSGAQKICGGEIPVGKGYHYPPTLLADCDPSMRLFQEDFFGPVVAVASVNSVQEAIQATNRCDMGLAASIWTTNLSTGQQIAQQLRVGSVSINEILMDAADAELPFGGLRNSGFGVQRGIKGLEEFFHWKPIVTHQANSLRRHLFPYQAATTNILRAMVQMEAAKTMSAKFDAIRSFIKAAKEWRNNALKQTSDETEEN